MYNKTLIRFGFRENLNNQGLGSADNTYLDLDYSGISQKPYAIVYYNPN